jgi:hypothetical protein
MVVRSLRIKTKSWLINQNEIKGGFIGDQAFDWKVRAYHKYHIASCVIKMRMMVRSSLWFYFRAYGKHIRSMILVADCLHT